MHAPGRYANLHLIQSLDPEVDFDEILRLTARFEFPWDYVQGTGIAFMRDYGVPSIAELLDRTREFADHGVKRYDDTILIGDEATLDGIDSPRSHAALRRLNRIHGHYDISNDDFAYVLATTIVGPVRWIEAYGWRRLDPHELVAITRVTTRFGELMGIKGLPTTYDGYLTLLVDLAGDADRGLGQAGTQIQPGVADLLDPIGRHHHDGGEPGPGRLDLRVDAQLHAGGLVQHHPLGRHPEAARYGRSAGGDARGRRDRRDAHLGSRREGAGREEQRRPRGRGHRRRVGSRHRPDRRGLVVDGERHRLRLLLAGRYAQGEQRARENSSLHIGIGLVDSARSAPGGLPSAPRGGSGFRHRSGPFDPRRKRLSFWASHKPIGITVLRIERAHRTHP